MLGDAFLDFLDRYLAIVGPQNILQHVLGRLQGNRSADQIGIGDDPIERAFQLAHVGGDLMGEKFQNLGRYLNAHIFRLRLQYAVAQLIGRRMDIRHQSPPKPRFHTLFHALQIVWRFVGRNDHLAVLIHQGIEGMEEFFLCAVLAGDELDIVDHQDIDRTELLLEGDGVPETQGPDELIHEFFGRQVNDPLLGLGLADVPRDRVHEMGLAEPDAAIEEKRIIGRDVGFRDAARGGKGKFVRLADDEILEGKSEIKRGADIVSGLGFANSGRAGCRQGAVFVDGTVRHDNVDAFDAARFKGPEAHQALPVLRLDPIAHEPGRDGNSYPASLDTNEGHRLQPTAIRRFAVFRPQSSPDSRPLRR